MNIRNEYLCINRKTNKIHEKKLIKELIFDDFFKRLYYYSYYYKNSKNLFS